MVILGAWVYKVSHDSQLAGSPSPSTVVTLPEQKPEYVGRITGMADCRWSDSYTPPVAAMVPLGYEYSLAAGLMEITYTSGAKVILQGPCTYEVESPRGGFLSLGKLTARVEKREERRGERGENSTDHPSPLSPLPSSLFSVRTPTAVVTDLGTEFGVEVDHSGATQSHVFQGRIELRPAAGGTGDGGVVSLGVNESARVEPGQNRVVKVIGGGAQFEPFPRRMPRRVPIGVFNTGVGLKEGDPDPHWQLVARSDDPHFKPQPAVVTSYNVRCYVACDPLVSQYLSTANGSPELPNEVTYTFRTTFQLVGLFQKTAILRGWFIADNHVKSIRLNGKEAPVPKHGDNSFSNFHPFSIQEGYVEGTNVLEIEVENGAAVDRAEHRAASPMLLRVELEGSYLCGDRSSADEKTPKGAETHRRKP